MSSAFTDQTLKDRVGLADKAVIEIIERSPQQRLDDSRPDRRGDRRALSGREGIVYAEIDTALSVEPKQFHDVVGYYNRFDIFDLHVDRSKRDPARFADSNDLAAGSADAEGVHEMPAVVSFRESAPARRER